MHIRVGPRSAAIWLAAAGFLIGWEAPPPVHAQASWDARLDISTFPSPYLSDWESNPTIGTLTVSNPTALDQNVFLVYRVTDHRGGVIASGRSDRQLVARGPPTVLTDFVNLSGSSQHDQNLEDQMRRTGRLPEGDHRACVAVTDPGGFVLAEDCVTFSIVYPDPPYLIGPLDDAALASGHPAFQWTPLQVPPAFHLSYLVRVSEVLAGQVPAQALAANIPLFETTAFGTNLEYPLSAPPLHEGKTYAWQVQALDQNGYAASGNEGRSEIWTFTYEPSGGTVASGLDGIPINLSVRNDPRGTEPLTTAGLDGLCTAGLAEGSEVLLGVASRIGFIGLAELRALAFQRTLPDGMKAWALLGSDGVREYMAYGQCPLGLPVPKWIAVRTAEGLTTLEALVEDQASASAESPPYERQQQTELEFGMVFVALGHQTVEAPETREEPDGFEVVRSFLQNRKIEALRGINAFGVWRLAEQEWWDSFRELGFDEAEIELQGFAGMDATWGVAVGSDPGRSRERTFFTLRGQLPKRKPPAGHFLHDVQYTAWGIEFAIKDSSSFGAGASTTREHVLQITHTIAVNDDVTLVGALGLDYAVATEGTNTSRKLDLIGSYQCDCVWQLPARFWIGNPKGEFHSTLAGGDQSTAVGGREWSLALGGEGGWDKYPFLKAGVSLSREKTPTPPKMAAPEAALAKSEEWVKQAEKDLAVTKKEFESISGRRSALRLEVAFMLRGTPERAEAQERLRALERNQENAALAVKGAESRLESAKSEATKHRNERNAAIEPGYQPTQLHWRARASLGNMALLEMLQFFAAAGKAVVQAARQ